MKLVALFTTAKRLKQSKSPLSDEQISKLWYIHIREHYSTVKKNEVLLHATEES